MRTVFADTGYWIALISPRDQWHLRARRLTEGLRDATLVTSQFVFTELLAAVSAAGPGARERAVSLVRLSGARAAVTVVPATSELFNDGLRLFEARPDKGYSHVDCTSMVVMRELGLTDVLTGDVHFEQEGFAALMRR